MTARASNNSYWRKVRRRAAELGSDGCTGVPEFYHDCCLEHDLHYRTKHTVYGHPITKEEADDHFFWCMAARSRFGNLSPMAWWRWAAVRLFGGKAWRG